MTFFFEHATLLTLVVIREPVFFPSFYQLAKIVDQFWELLTLNCAFLKTLKILTVNFVTTTAETAFPCFAALKEPVVHISSELFELRLRRVHQINPSLTQDGRSDPALGGERHNQEHHRADTQYAAYREHDTLPQSRHGSFHTHCPATFLLDTAIPDIHC